MRCCCSHSHARVNYITARRVARLWRSLHITSGTWLGQGKVNQKSRERLCMASAVLRSCLLFWRAFFSRGDIPIRDIQHRNRDITEQWQSHPFHAP